MHPLSTVTKGKENVPPNISHTSANITKILFTKKNDNCAPPSAPSSAPTKYIASNTLVNQFAIRKEESTRGTN
jgi:hypothetical protein